MSDDGTSSGYVSEVLAAGGLASTGIATGMIWVGIAAAVAVVVGALAIRFARRRDV